MLCIALSDAGKGEGFAPYRLRLPERELMSHSESQCQNLESVAKNGVKPLSPHKLLYWSAHRYIVFLFDLGTASQSCDHLTKLSRQMPAKLLSGKVALITGKMV